MEDAMNEDATGTDQGDGGTVKHKSLAGRAQSTLKRARKEYDSGDEGSEQLATFLLKEAEVLALLSVADGLRQERG